MRAFIGAKVILAKPMSRGLFNDTFGNGSFNPAIANDEGYHVRYPGHNGAPDYNSWSPKEVFEEAYRELTLGETAFARGYRMTPGYRHTDEKPVQNNSSKDTELL